MAFKIKQLFDEITKQKVYPLTTTKAVKDTSTKKSLFEILNMTPMMEDGGEEVSDAEIRDADTLGGMSPTMFAMKSDYNGIICTLLADSWVEDDGSYKQTIPLPSLDGTEFFDVSLYDDGTATEKQIEEFSELITRVDTNVGEVVVIASEQPTVSFSIMLRGMCDVDRVVVADLAEVVRGYDETKQKCEKLTDSLDKFHVINTTISVTANNAYADVNIPNMQEADFVMVQRSSTGTGNVTQFPSSAVAQNGYVRLRFNQAPAQSADFDISILWVKV